MDAMDELQEADILWPDTEDDDEQVPFATMGVPMVMEVAPGSVSSIAPVFGRGERFFHPGAGQSSSPAAASPDAVDEEEWLEADVLWPDTFSVVPRGGGGGGLLLPFSSGSDGAGRRGSHPAAARHERWRPAASSPIDIPTRRLNLGRR